MAASPMGSGKKNIQLVPMNITDKSDHEASLPEGAMLKTPQGGANVITAHEDDDPYGLGNASFKGSSSYEQKDLELFQAKLLEEFKSEFKDNLSSVDNLPKGTILLSAIKACLLDENKLVKRGILDTIITFIR